MWHIDYAVTNEVARWFDFFISIPFIFLTSNFLLINIYFENTKTFQLCLFVVFGWGLLLDFVDLGWGLLNEFGWRIMLEWYIEGVFEE